LRETHDCLPVPAFIDAGQVKEGGCRFPGRRLDGVEAATEVLREHLPEPEREGDPCLLQEPAGDPGLESLAVVLVQRQGQPVIALFQVLQQGAGGRGDRWMNPPVPCMGNSRMSEQTR
jgi:hypothetical protein